MDREQARQLLSEYLDGELPLDVRKSVEDCLQKDPLLARELAQLQELLAAATSLPREVAPSRDLWPDISARLVTTGVAARSTPITSRSARHHTRLVRWWRPALAVAAVVTLIFFSDRLDQHGAATSDLTGMPSWQQQDLQALGARTMLNALEVECDTPQDPAVAHLAVPDRPLSVSSRGILAHNLRIVDLALADVSTAWLANPQDPLLTSLLNKLSRTRADLQSRKVELATQI